MGSPWKQGMDYAKQNVNPKPISSIINILAVLFMLFSTTFLLITWGSLWGIIIIILCLEPSTNEIIRNIKRMKK